MTNGNNGHVLRMGSGAVAFVFIGVNKEAFGIMSPFCNVHKYSLKFSLIFTF